MLFGGAALAADDAAALAALARDARRPGCCARCCFATYYRDYCGRDAHADICKRMEGKADANE